MGDRNHPPRDGEGDQPKAGGGDARKGAAGVLSQPIKAVRRARALRKTMSFAEVLLWLELRKRPGGFLFRKSVPKDPYTLDFACLAARLCIEVDGEAHERGDRPARDAVRDRVLAERGFATLRVTARDVLKNREGCVRAIVAACAERGTPPPPLRGGSPPRSGEDV